MDWKESYLIENSSCRYFTEGLQHYGDKAEDPESRLTLQAILTKNVNGKLSNPAFQGTDSSDFNGYLWAR